MRKPIDIENVNLAIEAFDNSRRMLELTLYETYYVACRMKNAAEQAIVRNAADGNREEILRILGNRIEELELSQLEKLKEDIDT